MNAYIYSVIGNKLFKNKLSGWGTHVYVWRIHFDIWQNQYNIVKLKNKIKWKKKKKSVLVSQLCLTLCASGFSRQEYWSVLPFPSPGDLSNPGIKLWSPTLQAYSLPSEPPGTPRSDSNAWARRKSTPLRFFLEFRSKLLRAYYMLFVCHSVHTSRTSVDLC